LSGKERDRDLSPRNQLIKLIVFGNDLLRVTSLTYESIKLSIKVSMNDESCIIPVIFPDSVQLHFNN
jgi:hypothetical protein